MHRVNFSLDDCMTRPRLSDHVEGPTVSHTRRWYSEIGHLNQDPKERLSPGQGVIAVQREAKQREGVCEAVRRDGTWPRFRFWEKECRVTSE